MDTVSVLHVVGGADHAHADGLRPGSDVGGHVHEGVD